MAQLHSSLTANHRPYAAVYADATERLAATGFNRALGGGIVAFDSTDLYKKALQLDDASEWVLTAITPTWVQVGGPGVAPGAHAASHQNNGSDEISVAGLSGVLADPQTPITEAVQDIIAAMIVAGSNITVTYDDGANTLTIAGTGGGGSIAPLTIIDANTVDQVNSTNAQTFRVYKTTTNNYRFSIKNVSNFWELRSDTTSGTPDPIKLFPNSPTKYYNFDMSNFLPPDDGVQNLGSLGQKWNLVSGVDFWSTAAGSFRFGSNSTVVKTAGDGVLDVQTQNSNVGGTVRFVPRTASQITADQNNYSSGGISKYQRWSSDASRNVTGFVTSPTQVTGQEHIITNVGSNPIVLVHESASSTAANRFLTNTGADITLGANEMALAFYDGTSSRWRVSKL